MIDPGLPVREGRARSQLVVAALMLVLVVVNAVSGEDDGGTAAWWWPLCALVSVQLGWICDRGLGRFVGRLPTPDDQYAIRALAALPIAVIGAPMVALASPTPTVVAVLSLALYWFVVEPLISSGSRFAVRARRSARGAAVVRLSRSPRVQHALRAITVGLVAIGGVNFALVELGVGGDPWVAVGIAAVVIALDLLAGPEGREEAG